MQQLPTLLGRAFPVHDLREGLAEIEGVRAIPHRTLTAPADGSQNKEPPHRGDPIFDVRTRVGSGIVADGGRHRNVGGIFAHADVFDRPSVVGNRTGTLGQPPDFNAARACLPE
jgi:hypothetical protein